MKFSKVHETKFIDLKMPAGDAAFIRIEGKFFKLAISGVPHHGLSCWNNDPLNIFTGKQTFYIHVKKWLKKEFDRKNLLLILVTVLGFLTQYFFLFFA